MGSATPMKIVIASAGRRAHYLEWFRDALNAQGIDGEVIAMEYRDTSPGFGLADQAVRMPAYNSAEYPEAIRSWFAEERPDLFFCMNDYEIQALSGSLADELRELGCLVTVLTPERQALVLDKYRMTMEFKKRGIPTPATWLGSDVDEVVETAPRGSRFVVKHRIGSGSSGLEFPELDGLREAVARSARSALGEDGRSAENNPAAVLVQEFLPGNEHGVDGVFSLDGSSELLGVLARRVDKMRDGDPDVATTASPEPFREVIAQVGEVLRPSGSINIDVREDVHGVARVIDVNPRLGGGYPYCHRAGADMPAALIRSARGLPHDPELLEYEPGVTTVRREEFTVISRGGVFVR
ncbi:hypothetical protein B841_09290 [Corynebacterium maris DSM 45190]|uniref:ATP-grasp domain-containing protein n=1 Tax=Corynebacterium maris DSM 45190 TaxID=1224163 RepID=S5TKA5_9CORY|nr:ATP-grasp domain-containing protein [Corynebacterium maris]AGS35331.1 hypothetical protein B841_09290 [Corynebacterium maris DSM 45190]